MTHLTRTTLRLLAIVLGCWLYATNSAEATLWYVDGSCSFNGNGQADQCAASGGAAGAYQAPQSCFTSALAGDTCYIKNGTYTRDVVDGGYRDASGFYPTHSGSSSSNRITFSNYPGHAPILRNCAGYVANECAGATITANGQSHIRLTGLHIVGAAHLHHTQSGAPCVGCVTDWVIDHNEFEVGWFADGNWSFIFLEAHTVPWIHHNLFHNMDVSNNRDQNQGSAVKLYHTEDGIIEFNTHLGAGFEATGIDDKENGQRNIQRFNYVQNINGGAYQVCIGAVTPYTRCADNRVYGNVAVNTGNLVRHLGGSGGNDDGTWDWNNTGYNIAVFNETPSDGHVINYRRWNNIIHGATVDNDYFFTANAGPSFSDYNVWTAGRGFTLFGVGYANLAAVVAGTTLEDHSTTTACTFVNAPTDLHTTGPCSTMCRVDGVPAGAIVACGAYGVTDCVGYLCDQAAPPPPPGKMRMKVRCCAEEDLATLPPDPLEYSDDELRTHGFVVSDDLPLEYSDKQARWERGDRPQKRRPAHLKH